MRIATCDTVKPPLRGRNATHITASTIGAIFGIAGFEHGLFEFLQGNKPTDGLIIQAIGPAQRFWAEGTEEAFTLIPNFRITGLAAMLVGLAALVWSLRFLHTKQGRKVFLGLFILLFLVGGGIGQVAFFIPAWAFATRMDKDLHWWRKVLPHWSWPLLATLWPVLLVLSSVIMLVGLEIAIFGYVPGVTDPKRLQDMSMSLVGISALLNVVAFIAGFGHELRKLEWNEGGV